MLNSIASITIVLQLGTGLSILLPHLLTSLAFIFDTWS